MGLDKRTCCLVRRLFASKPRTESFMLQPQVVKGMFPERRRVPRVPRRFDPPRFVLCVVPRGLRVDGFERRLPGYELSTAKSTTQTLRLARRGTMDLYVIHSPLDGA